jgi:lysophospholipase L1-like esterase
MRILLLGDSHLSNMSDAITSKYPQVSIMTIMIPGKISSITRSYQDKLQMVRLFHPDQCIIHAGHNELAKHISKNPSPSTSRHVTTLTLNLVRILSFNHPTMIINISATYPRTSKPASNLTTENTVKFNRTAKRHGQRLRTEATRVNIPVLLNMSTWRTISKTLEEASVFQSDGLHLTYAAKQMIAIGWLQDITGIPYRPIVPVYGS